MSGGQEQARSVSPEWRGARCSSSSYSSVQRTSGFLMMVFTPTMSRHTTEFISFSLFTPECDRQQRGNRISRPAKREGSGSNSDGSGKRGA